ncbi:hypothetical protein LguiA_013491 [Lonicera macranthoides]
MRSLRRRPTMGCSNTSKLIIVALSLFLCNLQIHLLCRQRRILFLDCPMTFCLGYILQRLDAKNFASAARVDKRWNRLCNGVFSLPKIRSFSGCVHGGLSMDKILSEPIRPQFLVVATKLGSIPLEHEEKLALVECRSSITHVGPSTPVVTNDCMAVFQEEENTISLQKFVTDIRSFSVAPLLIILFVSCDNDFIEVVRSERDVLLMALEISKEFPSTHFICGPTMPMQVDFQSRGDYKFHFQKERTGPYKKSSSSRVSYSQLKYEHGAALVFAKNGDLVAGIEIDPLNESVTQEGLVFVLAKAGSIVRVKINMQDGSQCVMMVGKMAYAWESQDEFFPEVEDD